MKIGSKLLLNFLIILIVPFSILSFVLLRNTQINLNNEITERLEILANDRKDEIQTYLNSKMEIAKLIAGRTVLIQRFAEYLKAPSQEQQVVLGSMLNDSLRSIDGGETLCILSLDGVTIASSDPKSVGIDRKNDHFFREGISEPKSHIDQEDGSINVLFTAPIIIDGNKIGYIHFVINSEKFQKIVSDKTGLGKTGEILLGISEDGTPTYLFNRLFENQAHSLEKGNIDLAIPMKEAIMGHEKILVGVPDYRGVNVVAASRYIESAKLGLVVKMDLKEAEEPLQNVQKTTGVIFLFSLFMSFLVAIIVSKSISEPIQKFTEQVQLILKKGSRQEIHIPGVENESEVGILIESFNQTMNELKNFYADLERKVHERTIALERSETKMKETLVEVERTNRIMMGRELNLIEMKEENQRLREELKKKEVSE